MKKTRRSHAIPRFYLNGFAIPGARRIWVGDLITRRIFLSNVNKVGVEKNYYAPAGAAHEDELEQRLAKIESNAAPQLRSFLTSRTDIEPDMGRFVAWLAARTSWLRRVVQETFPIWIQQNPELLRQQVGSEKHKFEFEHVASGCRERVCLGEALKRVHDQQWQLRIHQDQYLDMIRLQAYLFQKDHFPYLQWFRLTAPEGFRFITSDRPVSWDILEVGVGDSPAALKHPLVELTLPLDSTHALIAGGALSDLTDRTVTVQEVNKRTVSYAERYIYGSHEKDIETHLADLRTQTPH